MHTKPIRTALFITLSLLAAFLIYRTALIQVISAVINREGSSHGVFVPLLTAYFLWEKRNTIRNREIGFDFRGFFLLGLALIFPLFSIGTFHLHYISFIVFVLGLILVVLGKEIFKVTAFPVFFLIAMTPMTGETYMAVADFCRLVTFKGSQLIISLIGIPYYTNGWMIQLPNSVLEVAIACSGIRYLISYFIFGIAYAYLVRDTFLSRLVVVASTIPLAFAAGVMRLTAIFTATYYISPRMAEHKPHVLISWSVFFGFLMLAIALDQYVQKRQAAKKLGGQEAGMLEGLEAGRRVGG